MKVSKGVGYCGLICDLCQDDPNCVGCRQGGCSQKESCKNYQCCLEKGYLSCYDCVEFPCDDSILHKLRVRTFCKLIGEYGEEKIVKCLRKNEVNGIFYHKGGSHYGDYDNVDTEEEIIHLIFNGKDKENY